MHSAVVPSKLSTLENFSTKNMNFNFLRLPPANPAIKFRRINRRNWQMCASRNIKHILLQHSLVTGYVKNPPAPSRFKCPVQTSAGIIICLSFFTHRSLVNFINTNSKIKSANRCCNEYELMNTIREEKDVSH